MTKANESCPPERCDSDSDCDKGVDEIAEGHIDIDIDEKEPNVSDQQEPHSAQDEDTSNVKENKKVNETNEEETLESCDGSQVSIENFKILALLGSGFCGQVYLVKSVNLPDERIYAMKVIDKEDMLRRNRIHKIMTEREIMALACHPFIVSLYYSFQTKKHLFLVTQYCAGGEFFSLLQKQENKRLQEKHAKFYAAEVLIALEYLHLLGFIYRDLKPENILVHESGHLMLTDFDLSKQQSTSPLNVSPKKRRALWFRVRPKRKSSSSRLNFCCACQPISHNYPDVDTETHLEINPRRRSFVGTHEYIAPEIIAEEGYSGSVDWWAFGILLYEMLFSKTPFKGGSNMETLGNILDTSEELTFPQDIPVSKACKDLLSQLLNKFPEKRLCNPVTIRQHPFFRDINWPLIRHETPPIQPTILNPLNSENLPEIIESELPFLRISTSLTTQEKALKGKDSSVYSEVNDNGQQSPLRENLAKMGSRLRNFSFMSNRNLNNSFWPDDLSNSPTKPSSKPSEGEGQRDIQA